ncbi:hypothetical protein ONZ45_g4630 [Pleurotus djamor]|nr:hypothetical protein ONZ45_g4630 [Pleurotus djamor]
MSSAPPPANPPSSNPEKKPSDVPSESPQTTEDTPMEAPPAPVEETWDDIPEDIKSLSTDDIMTRNRLIDNDIKVMRSERTRLQHEQKVMQEKIRDNGEKIKQNKVLPYLVGNVVEILDVDPEVEEDGANQDLDSMRRGKCAVIKTSTRQTVFLPLIGLVPAEDLKPGDLVGVNKDSYLVLDMLPAEFDSRVKAMEVDERPTESYTDIGGLEKQIEELVEAIVLPMAQADKFKTLGIRPPKGCLMYGPPGTGKTLLARACAAQTSACYLKLAGPSLVQMFIGDGAKLVRDAFALAKEKAPAIIFIDELDAIGTKRFDSEKSGDREVQRTMLELLNQLDGFSSDERIKVIAATNRIDILDPSQPPTFVSSHQKNARTRMSGDVGDAWTQSYVPITHDVISSQEIREKLQRHAQNWRGMTALASPQPESLTTVKPVAVPASPCANPAVRPPSYGLHTTAPISSESLITLYTSNT